MHYEMGPIKKKYAGRTDRATQLKMNTEIQEMYQKENYSPFAGCLPMLLQMLVLIAVYAVVCALHGLSFGVLYAPFYALIYRTGWAGMIAWIVAGFHFDLLHFFGSHFIAGIQVRMIFLCQPAICLLDLLVRCIGADPQNLIRIAHPDPPSVCV